MLFPFVGEAKTAFTNLKKRYSKKKNDLKRKKRSGKGKSDVSKFENALNQYKFLFWIDPYLKNKKETRSNLKAAVSESDQTENPSESSEDELSEAVVDMENQMQFDTDGHFNEPNEQEESIRQPSKEPISTIKYKRNDEKYESLEDQSCDSELESMRKAERNKSKMKKSKRNTSNDTFKTDPKKSKYASAGTRSTKEDPATEVLKSINRRLISKENEQLHSTQANNLPRLENKETEEDVLGKMVSLAMKKLPRQHKIQFKHDISSLIFQYEMLAVQSQAPQTQFTNRSTLRNNDQSNTSQVPSQYRKASSPFCTPRNRDSSNASSLSQEENSGHIHQTPPGQCMNPPPNTIRNRDPSNEQNCSIASNSSGNQFDSMVYY